MPSKNVYCAGKEGTFKFLENVLDEVFELFPSKIIHIGGDEVDKYLYNHCPDCQKRMVEEHLASADELQSYFIKRIE
ncbi:family 20 glycosylhydrolase, partial [Acinetobacter baumannii]